MYNLAIDLSIEIMVYISIITKKPKEFIRITGYLYGSN